MRKLKFIPNASPAQRVRMDKKMHTHFETVSRKYATTETERAANPLGRSLCRRSVKFRSRAKESE